MYRCVYYYSLGNRHFFGSWINGQFERDWHVPQKALLQVPQSDLKVAHLPFGSSIHPFAVSVFAEPHASAKDPDISDADTDQESAYALGHFDPCLLQPKAKLFEVPKHLFDMESDPVESKDVRISWEIGEEEPGIEISCVPAPSADEVYRSVGQHWEAQLC